jgi:hypothetical protein
MEAHIFEESLELALAQLGEPLHVAELAPAEAQRRVGDPA